MTRFVPPSERHRDRTADVLVLIAALTALAAVGGAVVVLPAVVGRASALRHVDPGSAVICPVIAKSSG